MIPFPTPSPIAHPSPTTHHQAKRHYYTCDSLTLPWQAEWYTAPFYSASSRSYDAAASLGPVNPPEGVLGSATACEVWRSVESSPSRGIAGTGPSSAGVKTGREGATELVVTLTQGGSTFESTVTFVLASSTSLPPITSASTTTSGAPSASGVSGRTSTATPIASNSASMSSYNPSATSSTLPSPSRSSINPLAQATDTSAINTCAGDMDFQAWGAIAGAGMAVLLGGLLWLLWAILRGRIPSIYSPRTYHVPPDHRPSKPFSFLAFFFPFLSGMTPPGSPGATTLPVVYASLKLLVMTSLVALAVPLPLFLVDTPCLAQTSPSNYLGGRLGSLTDLSLLRLLNSLDPAPESPTRDASIQLLLYHRYKRALPQTIGPALSSARVRLIVLLALIGLLSVVGGLWIIARAYASTAKKREGFEQQTCGGLDMVLVEADTAPGWKGMSEERLRKLLVDNVKTPEREVQEVAIVGLFAIPDTKALLDRVKQRERALLELESAEAEYLSKPHHVSSLPASPRSNVTDDKLSHGAIKAVGAHSDSVLCGPSATQTPHRRSIQAERSRFREINRNSLPSSFIRFEIGQRIKVDDSGKFVPDPSPESEDSHRLGEVSESQSEDAESGEQTISSRGGDARLSEGPARLTAIQPSPPYRSLQPSAVPSPASTHPVTRVAVAIARLKELNDEIEGMQLKASKDTTTGTDVVGWVVVGRGIRYIPGGRRIEGCTIEDIDWESLGQKSAEHRFWVKIIIIGLTLGLIMIPFIGLTHASTPGFAHYIPFLEPLGGSNGFGSGIAQGLVPAMVMSLIVFTAVKVPIALAERVPTISRIRRDSLATKAVFWLLLSLCIVWAVLLSSLELAVQGLSGEAQKARAIGDGSIHSTWWLFVFLLNVAIVWPALVLLQPSRLIRYLRQGRRAKTPRAIFRARQPPRTSTALLLACPLLAVLYTLSLSLIFPLLCIPLFILLYLSFIVLRPMSDHVHVDSGFSDGQLGLWLIRRLGWCLGVQPGLFGLIMLSRREWAIGGVSCGVGVLAVILAEILTARRKPEKRRSDLQSSTQTALDNLETTMRPSTRSPEHRRVPSDSSMLQRLTTLLPGFSRLPPGTPLPLIPETIDDLFRTELAAVTRSDLSGRRAERGERFFHDPSEKNKGLIYPPEMLAPVPVVWLPWTKDGRSEAEAADLEGMRGIPALVDPQPSRVEADDKGRGTGQGKEERTFLVG